MEADHVAFAEVASSFSDGFLGHWGHEAGGWDVVVLLLGGGDLGFGCCCCGE